MYHQHRPRSSDSQFRAQSIDTASVKIKEDLILCNAATGNDALSECIESSDTAGEMILLYNWKTTCVRKQRIVTEQQRVAWGVGGRTGKAMRNALSTSISLK